MFDCVLPTRNGRNGTAWVAHGGQVNVKAARYKLDERPLDPGRVYLLKHSARTVTAEINHALVLNQIGTVQVSTARPLVFDRYGDNRATGSFILIDPATQFTCGAGMITDPLRDAADTHHPAPLSFAERIAHFARRAASDEEAAEAVRKALEEMLT
jgi:sulfate adenylyltransferase subunit 1 (EFTu-like GTPase family)